MSAFCLSVRAFTNPPIGQALASRAFEGFVGAVRIVMAKGLAVIIAEVKFRKVAVQTGFTDMVEVTKDATLQDSERADNQLPISGIYPNRPGPIIRLVDDAYDLAMATWGMPTPAQFLTTKTGKPMAYDPGVTNIRNASSPHWRRWLGIEHRCLVPVTSFAENAPVTYTPTWFALSSDRPQMFFAGIRDNLSRQIRAKDEGPTEGEFYGFLTTEPNAEVRVIHPKAMPVILTTFDECETWLTAPWDAAKALQKPLPDGTLKVVHQGKGDTG